MTIKQEFISYKKNPNHTMMQNVSRTNDMRLQLRVNHKFRRLQSKYINIKRYKKVK